MTPHPQHVPRAIAKAMRWSLCMLWVCVITGSAAAAFALPGASDFLQERPNECDASVFTPSSSETWSPNSPAASMMRDASLMDDAEIARLLQRLHDSEASQGCDAGALGSSDALCVPEEPEGQLGDDDGSLWDPLPTTATLSEDAFRALGEARSMCMFTSSPDQCESQPPLPSVISIDIATPGALRTIGITTPRGPPPTKTASVLRVRVWTTLQIGASDGHGRLPEMPPRG